VPPEAVRALDGIIRNAPFHEWLRVEAVDAAPGRAVLRIPPNPDFVGNPFIPAVHGGIIAALIDLAGGAALFVELQFPTPTIDMRVDYLRPAVAGKALVADARVKRLGATVAFVDIDVWQPSRPQAARLPHVEPPRDTRGDIDVHDEDGRLVATGRCAYSVKDREQGPRGFPIG
jgi:uncharacterized protein (TIGR00369 family)